MGCEFTDSYSSRMEAIAEMQRGVRFSYHGGELYFDYEALLNGKYPYRFREANTDEDIAALTWKCIEDWERIPDWRENIGKGVLCKVWDIDSGLGFKSVVLVTAYAPDEDNGRCYISAGLQSRWQCAEPLSAEVVAEYTLES